MRCQWPNVFPPISSGSDHLFNLLAVAISLWNIQAWTCCCLIGQGANVALFRRRKSASVVLLLVFLIELGNCRVILCFYDLPIPVSNIATLFAKGEIRLRRFFVGSSPEFSNACRS